MRSERWDLFWFFFYTTYTEVEIVPKALRKATRGFFCRIAGPGPRPGPGPEKKHLSLCFI